MEGAPRAGQVACRRGCWWLVGGAVGGVRAWWRGAEACRHAGMGQVACRRGCWWFAGGAVGEGAPRRRGTQACRHAGQAAGGRRVCWWLEGGAVGSGASAHGGGGAAAWRRLHAEQAGGAGGS